MPGSTPGGITSFMRGWLDGEAAPLRGVLWGFESLPAHHSSNVLGRPVPKRVRQIYGAVAQLGERQDGILKVVGSIPIRSTISQMH